MPSEPYGPSTLTDLVPIRARPAQPRVRPAVTSSPMPTIFVISPAPTQRARPAAETGRGARPSPFIYLFSGTRAAELGALGLWKMQIVSWCVVVFVDHSSARGHWPVAPSPPGPRNLDGGVRAWLYRRCRGNSMCKVFCASRYAGM
jgi:hypothetical protein